MRRNNGGFTLIELIVVIVILGILAVTAAPKFIDLQSDARLATLNGMKAAINSAVSLTYGKSLVKGVEKNATGSKVSINGEEVEVCYGYPCAAATKIQKVLDIGDFKACTAGVAGDWCFEDGAAELCYKVTDFYHPGDEIGIAWNDPKIGIDWASVGVKGEYKGTASPEGYTIGDTPLILSAKDCKNATIETLNI